MRSVATDAPHRRYNPLADEWVLVSPHRTRRPWLGAEEAPARVGAAYDPTCALCPGNERAGGGRNPEYSGTYVFPNDFPAVLPTREGERSGGLFRSEPVAGECRVVVFSPRHDLTLAEMAPAEIEGVIEMWGEQSSDLGSRWRWVQVFENKGEAMGCSNPHPHGQVWATDALPTLPAREDAAQARHLAEHGRPLLLDGAGAESGGERVVAENEAWLLIVPFWATWPFETLLLPKRRVARLPEVTADERRALAAILKDGLSRYDRLFATSFPYTMGWHGAPFGERDGGHWTLHAHFHPPLLRSATVKKFMVGFEMLAEAQRDLTPEAAAARLREA